MDSIDLQRTYLHRRSHRRVSTACFERVDQHRYRPTSHAAASYAQLGDIGKDGPVGP